MTDIEPGYADLRLESDGTGWSLYADVSEQALSIIYLYRNGFLPSDESLFPVDTEYSIKLLDGKTVHADDKVGTATLVDKVDAISLSISHFDLETNRMVTNGRIHDLGVTSARAGDGVRLGMSAIIKRPESVSDAQVESVASEAMRSIAMKMAYLNEDGGMNSRKYESMVNDMVGVTYSRQRGVTVTTNPLGSCSLDTDGNRYDPDSELIELYQHNLYTHAQQLICLVGVVAIANADVLVK